MKRVEKKKNVKQCSENDGFNKCHDLDTEYIDNLMKPLVEIHKEISEDERDYKDMPTPVIEMQHYRLYQAIKQTVEEYKK